jgi:hypothetical protein
MTMSSDDDVKAAIDRASSIDEETAQDIRDDFETSDEDVSRWQRIGAGVQLAILFSGVGIALGASVYFGYIDPKITVLATVNAGWVFEYFIIGFTAAFLLYVFTLIVMVLPGSVLKLLGGLAYGAAVAAGLVNTSEE